MDSSRCSLLPTVPSRAALSGSKLERLYERRELTVSLKVMLNMKVFSVISVAASPGYFTTTFVNGIKLEATSTRRAGLIRFTYPEQLNENLVVVDLTNDLQRSFEGGSLNLTAATSRVTLTGTFLQVCILRVHDDKDKA